MNEPDRNVLGVIFAQVEVKKKKSSYILCALEDVEFDKNTKFIDVLMKVNADDNFLSKYDVIATMHPSSQLKDAEASPVRNLTKLVHLYHFPNSRYVRFTATLLSELPEPPEKRRCLNHVLTSNLNSQFKFYNVNSPALCNLSVPNKFAENKELNAKHQTYNKLIEYFTDKKLGWMGNEHESSFKRREKGYERRQGYGAQFIDKLSSLLSQISQHRASLERKFKYAEWLKDVTVIKSSRKRDMSSIDIKHGVLQLRQTIKGEWIQYNCWKSYVADVFQLMDSLERYCEARDKELEIQTVNRKSERPARGPEDCRILTTSYVGRAGLISDPRHKKVSLILQKYPPFKPYFISEALCYYGHDFFKLNLRKKANLRESFLRKPPQLRVYGRGLSYVPGGAYKKMIWMWKTNNYLSDSKLAEENSKVEYHIKSNLPKFLSKAAASMIDMQISRVTATKSAAGVIRQYIVGDSRMGTNMKEQERQERIANYIMSSDELERSVIDLRESNGAKHSFNEWFDFEKIHFNYRDEMS